MITSKPPAFNTADTRFDKIGLEFLPSNPTTMGPVLKYVANEYVKSIINGRVNSRPYIPLTPLVPNNRLTWDSFSFILNIMINRQE